MSLPIAIRGGSLADLEALQQLANECVGAPAWSALVWRQTLASAQSPGQSRLVLLALLEGKLVGFAILHKVAGEGELESVGVTPSARRCGIGSRLCAALMQRAKAAGLERIGLEVRESNRAALALYRQTGFAEEGKRLRYYTAPPEDALLFGKRL